MTNALDSSEIFELVMQFLDGFLEQLSDRLFLEIIWISSTRCQFGRPKWVRPKLLIFGNAALCYSCGAFAKLLSSIRLFIFFSNSSLLVNSINLIMGCALFTAARLNWILKLKVKWICDRYWMVEQVIIVRAPHFQFALNTAFFFHVLHMFSLAQK